MKTKYTEEELKTAVNESLSIAEVCRKLGIKPHGGNYKTLKLKFKKFNIDTSHFTGQAWNQGLRFREFGIKKSLKDVLVENSTYINTNSLKKRLIKEGLKNNKCEECGINSWNGKDLVCELDHVNGINDDNRIENLKILCPNCHSQTKTFRGKSKKSSKISLYEKYNSGELVKIEKVVKKKPIKSKVDKICNNHKCNNVIIDRSHRNKYCSVECYREVTSQSIPKVPELLESFKELKNFSAVGRNYGVSDNAVRKWVKKYGIEEFI